MRVWGIDFRDGTRARVAWFILRVHLFAVQCCVGGLLWICLLVYSVAPATWNDDWLHWDIEPLGASINDEYVGMWYPWEKDGPFRYVCERSQQDGPCPPGWFEYADSCYGRFAFEVSYGDAWLDCAEHGAHLVSIASHAENEYVKSLCGYVTCWLGLTYEFSRREWVWDDGTVLGQDYRWQSYQNWDLLSVPAAGTQWPAAYMNQWTYFGLPGPSDVGGKESFAEHQHRMTLWYSTHAFVAMACLICAYSALSSWDMCCTQSLCFGDCLCSCCLGLQGFLGFMAVFNSRVGAPMSVDPGPYTVTAGVFSVGYCCVAAACAVSSWKAQVLNMGFSAVFPDPIEDAAFAADLARRGQGGDMRFAPGLPMPRVVGPTSSQLPCEVVVGQPVRVPGEVLTEQQPQPAMQVLAPANTTVVGRPLGIRR